MNNIERFLKQSVVDKNPFIVASTLIAGQHIIRSNPELIKRWTNELQEVVASTNRMVQFHGLALTYQTKASDKVAIAKIMTGLSKNPPRGTTRRATYGTRACVRASERM